jgi:hypothetical protein
MAFAMSAQPWHQAHTQYAETGEAGLFLVDKHRRSRVDMLAYMEKRRRGRAWRREQLATELTVSSGAVDGAHR